MGSPTPEGTGGEARLVGVCRGDPFSPHTASGTASFLFDALARRYALVDRIDVSLGPAQRALAAAVTFRPALGQWRARYYRSRLGFRLQSRNCEARLAQVREPYDLVLQVFGLFETRGSPYVLYVDNTHHLTRSEWPEWSPFGEHAAALWYRLERRVFHRARHVFAMTAKAAESVSGFYGVPAERVSVVGGGVCFEPLPQETRRTTDPTVLFVGRSYAGVRLKGLDTLLEAFETVRERVPAARLRIVGTLDVQAGPGVEVVGPVNDRDRLGSLYREAGVFCLPSRFEPYSSAVREAMAHGLPCVVTSVGGFPDLVVHEENGLLVPPGNPGELAAALVCLLTDPTRADALGAAGRRRVETHLTWEHVVERMAPVLSRLVPLPSS